MQKLTQPTKEIYKLSRDNFQTEKTGKTRGDLKVDGSNKPASKNNFIFILQHEQQKQNNE